MRRRTRIAVAIAATVAAVVAATPGAAPGATPGAAWTINAIPYPSTFEAGTAYHSDETGPGYLVQAYNAGAKASEGTFTLTDTLPAGLLPAPGFPPHGVYGPQLEEIPGVHAMSCTTLGRKVTCTGGSEGPVGAGEGISVIVPVEVQANAAQKAAEAGGFLADQAAIEGGAAAAAQTSQPTPVVAHGASAQSPFGFLQAPAGLHGEATLADGSPATQAGSHPYSMTVAALSLATGPGDALTLLASGGGLREATVTLPKGLVVNPAAVPRCKESELESGEVGCPDASQVGTIALTVSPTPGFGLGPVMHPVYNMVPPPGSPAELGFEVLEGVDVHLLGAVSSDGTFTLTANSRDVLARAAIGGVRTTLWGVPSEEVHDHQRGRCLFQSTGPGCAVPRTGRPFVTLPSSCGGPLATGVAARSWLGEPAGGSYLSSSLAGEPVGVAGCGALEFSPTIEARPSTDQGDSPAGLQFALHVPQHKGAGELATANLRDATVTLPVGMTVNPSAGSGLEGCSAAQIGLFSAIGASPVRFREGPAHCPDASKLGTAEGVTPVLVDEPTAGTQLPHVLKGSVYLAKPFDNPFGSLLGLYLVLEDEQSGIIAKLAGRAEPDPVTGQLTATFAENPELPVEDVKLSLFGGPRASLTTPLACGTHTTTSALVPWSAPEGATAHPTDSFQTTDSCSASEAAAPKAYGFEAGTVTPLSGSYSPFVLKLTRPDGSQHLTGLDLTLPGGLTGKLAGIPYCPEAGIARAQARSNPEEGKLEQADPSCPEASEVGTVTVGAGSGPSPLYVTGRAYLAGPYKGAPLSMVIITPAVAGPFDLGVVVVRTALQVGLETAQIHAVSDPLPTILDGIPIDVRSVALSLDRPGFTLNPTSCEAKAIEGQVTTQPGQSSPLSNHFQVGECGRLKFNPKLSISLKGGTKKAGHPALKAVVTYPKGGSYANLAKAQVALPHSEFIDQGNLNKVCTQPQLKSKTCPKTSIYGKVKVWTPLLEKPLEGNVYLGVGYGYKLPAVVAELDGQIRVLVASKVDTAKDHGIRSTFEAVPDQPLEKFVLEMKGGKNYGLFENSEDLCKKKQVANAVFTAQNGKVLKLSPTIGNSCKGKKGGGKTGNGKKGGGKKGK
ncbi:MAG TPA: hypothetical protein VJL81_01010 [Solirubrobacterales bacterium]|nr:hypothetical protein [Solirubrobacterales bacterium]